MRRHLLLQLASDKASKSNKSKKRSDVILKNQVDSDPNTEDTEWSGFDEDDADLAAHVKADSPEQSIVKPKAASNSRKQSPSVVLKDPKANSKSSSANAFDLLDGTVQDEVDGIVLI